MRMTRGAGRGHGSGGKVSCAAAAVGFVVACAITMAEEAGNRSKCREPRAARRFAFYWSDPDQTRPAPAGTGTGKRKSGRLFFLSGNKIMSEKKKEERSEPTHEEEGLRFLLHGLLLRACVHPPSAFLELIPAKKQIC